MCMHVAHMLEDFHAGEGYKVFRKVDDPNELKALCRNMNGDERFSMHYPGDKNYFIGENYEAVTKVMRGEQNIYPTGFHILPTLEDAQKVKEAFHNSKTGAVLVIAKVKYNNAFAKGIDETGVACLLASWMRIIEVVE